MTWASQQNGVFADFGSFFASEHGPVRIPPLARVMTTKAFRAIR
jgi:hypothetical protein